MTTTIFRKENSSGAATIASDTRITFINECNDPIKWIDDSGLKKNVTLDGVMYGFAGVNAIYQMFLENYDSPENSIPLLDSLIKLAQEERCQFFMLRYDGVDLRLFANSPESQMLPEIYKVSTDNIIKASYYAIGSGKESKQYKKHRTSKHAKTPIFKIINANNEGLKSQKLLHLNNKAKEGIITKQEAMQAAKACDSNGGDLFTGGEVTMSQNTTKKDIEQQQRMFDDLNKQAKSLSAVCASPINATLEVEHLRRAGHTAVSKQDITLSTWHKEKIESLRNRFNELV